MLRNQIANNSVPTERSAARRPRPTTPTTQFAACGISWAVVPKTDLLANAKSSPFASIKPIRPRDVSSQSAGNETYARDLARSSSTFGVGHVDRQRDK